MHWKQRSMTGTDRWGDKLHIYTMYYILTQHCHLSYIGQGENKAVLFGFFVILSLTLYPLLLVYKFPIPPRPKGALLD